MPIDRTVRWRPRDGSGLEHLELRQSAGGILVRSVLIGEREGVRFGARYDMRLDPDWTFRFLILDRMDGATLRLDSDGRGGWTRDGSVLLPQLDDCIDIDISATPFTNTLPIRRAHLEPGMPQRFRMAWVPLDTLEPFADEQIYTRHDDRHFRYQSGDGTFEAELTVDADGLVVDYPALFARA